MNRPIEVLWRYPKEDAFLGGRTESAFA
jgi:hypothetical protein